MISLNKVEMPQLPDSLVELKEYCSNCGKTLGSGSSFVKATIEQITNGGNAFLIDSDKRYFCEDCLRSGIYINVKDPEANEI